MFVLWSVMKIISSQIVQWLWLFIISHLDLQPPAADRCHWGWWWGGGGGRMYILVCHSSSSTVRGGGLSAMHQCLPPSLPPGTDPLSCSRTLQQRADALAVTWGVWTWLGPFKARRISLHNLNTSIMIYEMTSKCTRVKNGHLHLPRGARASFRSI